MDLEDVIRYWSNRIRPGAIAPMELELVDSRTYLFQTAKLEDGGRMLTFLTSLTAKNQKKP